MGECVMCVQGCFIAYLLQCQNCFLITGLKMCIKLQGNEPSQMSAVRISKKTKGKKHMAGLKNVRIIYAYKNPFVSRSISRAECNFWLCALAEIKP